VAERTAAGRPTRPARAIRRAGTRHRREPSNCRMAPSTPCC
jgi:hypothetical protein